MVFSTMPDRYAEGMAGDGGLAEGTASVKIQGGILSRGSRVFPETLVKNCFTGENFWQAGAEGFSTLHPPSPANGRERGPCPLA